METQRRAIHGREHAIQDERMEVEIEVERTTEALDDDDAAGAAVTDAGIPRAVSQPAKHGLRKYRGHRAAQIVVPREQVPQPVRQTQHPLADRYVGEDVVH
jgi:hypothetical protein